MGLFNLFKKKKEDNDKTTTKIVTGRAINSSIEVSTKQAGINYSRPDYNPQTRKAYYDSGEMHRKVISDAFSNGESYCDPYTGAELLAKQKDAKLKYGSEWQSHSAEADHIDPLNKIVNRNANNPFLTTEDLKEIGNSEDNYQIISRRLNQGSTDVGKGGSTQSEWVNDKTRMDGLKKEIKSGESIESVKRRINEKGKAAERRNDRKARVRGLKNAVNTANDAGKSAALNASVTAATTSSIINVVSVINGEKDVDEALTDIAKDSGKAAVQGYVIDRKSVV